MFDFVVSDLTQSEDHFSYFHDNKFTRTYLRENVALFRYNGIVSDFEN